MSSIIEGTEQQQQQQQQKQEDLSTPASLIDTDTVDSNKSKSNDNPSSSSSTTPISSSSFRNYITNLFITKEQNVVNNQQFENITTKHGIENGLFKCCMKAIRSQHVQSNKLRMAIIVTGLFTDPTIYRDIICSFYVVTRTAENKMFELAESNKNDPICAKLVAYGFSRTKNYEQDLYALFQYDDNWKEKAEQVAFSNKATVHYVETIQNCSDGTTVAGALFAVWGALILGGGAIARNRILKLCGKDCIHIYDNIYERTERTVLKDQFYTMWDSLATDPNSTEFQNIVTSCRHCMDNNNSIFSTYQKNPWWIPYITATAIGVIGIGLYQITKAKY